MKIETHTRPAAQMLKQATIAFIQEAHRGQKYDDMPYFFHPVEVAIETEALARVAFGDDFEMVADAELVALLHDVVEDTDYTEAQLRQRYSDYVVDAVMLVTLDPDLRYHENIQRIIDSRNLLALIVKLADNRVNRRGDKSKFTAEKAQRLNDKYDMSMAMISKALHDMGIYV